MKKQCARRMASTILALAIGGVLSLGQGVPCEGQSRYVIGTPSLQVVGNGGPQYYSTGHGYWQDSGVPSYSNQGNGCCPQPACCCSPPSSRFFQRSRCTSTPYQTPQVYYPNTYPSNGCCSGTYYSQVPGTVITEPSPVVVVERPKQAVTENQTVEGDGADTTTPEPEVKPWDQWANLPPLQGDFPSMIYQAAGDIDWLLVAHGDKFSADVRAMLQEAKIYLDTSCQKCDEDPELFAGTAGSDAVRDVTTQLNRFQDLLGQAMQQPEMQQMQDLVAPARADISKRGAVFGQLDATGREKMFGMFALETLQKRGEQLIGHAKAIEQGTFQPVGLNTLASQLKVGDMAPGFSLQAVDGETISLEDYKGKQVVLVFNRGHWCPFCMNQVNQLIDAAPAMAQNNAEVVVIFRELRPGTEAADGIAGLRDYKLQTNPPFPIAVDFGSVSTAAYSQDGHYTTYVIDETGRIKNIMRGVTYIRPSAEAMVNAVASGQ